jgi:hypothetical protein
MFASALTSRSTPLWRSACSTKSRPPCRSPGPRSRRRNGRHRSLPVLQHLRCHSPAPAPSTARLISRPDPAPAVLGLHVAVGDPALDEPASETAFPAVRQFALRGWLDDGVEDWSTSGMCRLLLAAWDSPGCSRRYRTPGLVLLIAPAGVVPATGRLPSRPRAVAPEVYYLGTEHYRRQINAVDLDVSDSPLRLSTSQSPKASWGLAISGAFLGPGFE